MTSPLNGFQQGAVVNTQSFGNRPESVEIPFITNRAPTTQDTGRSFFPIGKRWINTISGSEYVLTSFSTSLGITTANWTLLGSGATGGINSITGDSGGAEVSLSGNFNILGTANQITVTGSSNTQTLSIPTNFIAPGSAVVTTALVAGTSITSTLGNLHAVNGNLVLDTLGNKLIIPAGVNGSVGISAPMSGTPGIVTITSSAITTSSIILYSRNISGGVEGNISISAQSAGSFTLTSTGNETSTFNYLIIN